MYGTVWIVKSLRMECNATNLLNGPLCRNVTANRKRDKAERKTETRNSIICVMRAMVIENTDNKDTKIDLHFSVNTGWKRNTWLRNLLCGFVLYAWARIITPSIRRTRGTRWRSWLRHCATSLRSRVRFPMMMSLEFYHWHISSGCTMVLTQPLTEMSTRNISWEVKTAGADNLTTFMCRLSGNLGASNSWNPKGLPRPAMELLYLYLLGTRWLGREQFH
jgi:hypothetical protein